VLLKLVPKPAYDPENCSENRLLMYTGKNLTIESKGNPEQKFDAAFEKL
jgi:hypothetical protein